MNTIVEVTELEVMNCRVGVTAQVRKRVLVKERQACARPETRVMPPTDVSVKGLCFPA